MYKVSIKFKDLNDNHIYEIGDIFPYDNRKIDEKRIKQLSSKKNNLKEIIIEEFHCNVKE